MKIIVTSDGSHTLYNVSLDETYHSRHGAIRESLHVFIKNGFRFFITENNKNTINVFELGFGTGLNATLTAIESGKLQKEVSYTTIEPYPLPGNIVEKLNYPEFIPGKNADYIFARIHRLPWEEECRLDNYFSILKLKITIENYMPEKLFDLIYFDAFAPSKQPGIWEYPIIEKTYNLLAENGIFITYSSQGQLKRNLKSIGYQVEVLQGPPGKKEMVRAIK